MPKINLENNITFKKQDQNEQKDINIHEPRSTNDSGQFNSNSSSFFQQEQDRQNQSLEIYPELVESEKKERDQQCQSSQSDIEDMQQYSDENQNCRSHQIQTQKTQSSRDLQLQVFLGPQKPISNKKISQDQMEMILSDEQQLSQKSEKESEIQESDLFKRISSKILKKKPAEKIFNRNQNMKTFFAKRLNNYSVKYYEQYPGFEQKIKENYQTLIGQKETFTNESLASLINGTDENQEQSFINRQAMKLILRTHLKEEVIQNKRIPRSNKKNHLNRSKVFSLRCMSSELIKRTHCN